MHVYLFSPMYLQETVDRWHYYPPPDNGTYSYPWLWYDGDPHGGWEYQTWQAKIETRLNQPSPVNITMWGDYSPQTHDGTIFAAYRNDSTSAISGRIIWVVTEDSIYYSGTNGDVWHNHVARDYLPDQNGSTVTILPGDSITLNQPFTIQSTWNENRCSIITWIQNDMMQPDSTKEIWQGCQEKLMDLATGIQESETAVSPSIQILPNPGRKRFEIKVKHLHHAGNSAVRIYDATGHLIKSFALSPVPSAHSIFWNRSDTSGNRVPAGVYMVRIDHDSRYRAAKLVLID